MNKVSLKAIAAISLSLLVTLGAAGQAAKTDDPAAVKAAIAALYDKTASAPTSTGGWFLTTFKKQADGSWKIFRDCVASRVPPK